jgi:hypothetical protein
LENAGGALSARYLPSTDSWLHLLELAAPTLRFERSAVSTGRGLILFAGAVLENNSRIEESGPALASWLIRWPTLEVYALDEPGWRRESDTTPMRSAYAQHSST